MAVRAQVQAELHRGHIDQVARAIARRSFACPTSASVERELILGTLFAMGAFCYGENRVRVAKSLSISVQTLRSKLVRCESRLVGRGTEARVAVSSQSTRG